MHDDDLQQTEQPIVVTGLTRMFGRKTALRNVDLSVSSQVRSKRSKAVCVCLGVTRSRIRKASSDGSAISLKSGICPTGCVWRS